MDSRAARRAADRESAKLLGRVNKILQKLSKEDQKVIGDYYEQTALHTVDETWEIIEVELVNAARNHRISEERINLILAEMKANVTEHEGKIYKLQEVPYEVHIGRSKFEDLAEQVFCSKCEGCKGKNLCDIRDIFNKNGIPVVESIHKDKCKFAYKKVGYKVE